MSPSDKQKIADPARLFKMDNRRPSLSMSSPSVRPPVSPPPAKRLRATEKIEVPTGPLASQDQCPLFRLSAEIRNQIYELILCDVEPDDQDQVAIVRKKSDEEWRLPTPFELLGTCRLIYSEAAGIFYGLNNIRIDLHGLGPIENAVRDLRILGRSSRLRLQGLRHLTLTFCFGHRNIQELTMALRSLRGLSALRTLLVKVMRMPGSAWYGYIITDNEMKVEKHFLKRAVTSLMSVEEIRFELARDIWSPYREVYQRELDEVARSLRNPRTAESWDRERRRVKEDSQSGLSDALRRKIF